MLLTMRTLLALIVLVLANTAAALAQPPDQPLAITIAGPGASARRLEQYTAGQPIDVKVAASQGIAGVTVRATSADGISQSLPLQAGANGSFQGSLTLATAGMWQIMLVTRSGGTSTETTPFTLDVRESSADMSWLVGVAVGSGVFALVGGCGFVFLRRETAVASQHS
jgi:hypothetical protein